MAHHEKMITTIKEIVKYYSDKLIEEDIAVDFPDLHKRCWHCGDVGKLYRCHIVPSSAGGQDVPSNYVLLCRRCHEQAPNCTDGQIMMDWLKADSSKIYGLYWGRSIYELYAKLYKQDFLEQYNNRKDINQELLNQLIFSKFTEIKTHIGEGHINLSTWVGLFKMAFDEFDDIQTEQSTARFFRKYGR